MHDLELWNRALLLSHALTEFAPPALLEALANAPAPDLGKSLTPPAGLDTLEMLKAVVGNLDAHNAAMQRRQDAQTAIEHAVFARYRSGELLLIGFEGKRTIQSVPVRIPRDLLGYLPDWNTGTYMREGLSLTQLRMIERPKEDSQDVIEEPRGPGRPGLAKYVRNAFEEMVQSGKINAKASMKSQLPELRRLMREAGCADAERTSYEGIREHLSPLFREFKKNRKQ